MKVAIISSDYPSGYMKYQLYMEIRGIYAVYTYVCMYIIVQV